MFGIMRNMKLMQKVFGCVLLSLLASGSYAAAANSAMPSSITRYASDAYPGFDNEDNIVATSKKTPRWFSWINGPEKDNSLEQFRVANEYLAKGSIRAARRAYDALVREWPTSKEASLAQEALADLYLEKEKDYPEAFEEYKYLLDFYSSDCDYKAIAYRMYQTALLMEEEGKTIMFFRFANTVDVRRAFEAVVLRAPGANYAPKAMLKIATLREDAGEFEKAVQVYENLRNIYANTTEAKLALHLEARVRMMILREYGYNRSRVSDTIAYLKMALLNDTDSVTKQDYKEWLNEAVGILEEEAFLAAKFYDSRTRTKRSAINAYEKFLRMYPASKYAPEARERLKNLSGVDEEE